MDNLPFHHSQNSNSHNHANGQGEDINLHHGQLDFDHKFHKKPQISNQQNLEHNNYPNNSPNKGESQPFSHDLPHMNINHKSPTNVQNNKHSHYIHDWPNKHFHERPTPQSPFRNHQSHSGIGSNQVSATDKPMVNKGYIWPTKSHQNHQVLHNPHTNGQNDKWPDNIRPTDHKEIPKHHKWDHKPTQYPDEKVIHHSDSAHENNQGHQQLGDGFGHIKHHQSPTIISIRPTSVNKQINHKNGNVKVSKTKPTKVCSSIFYLSSNDFSVYLNYKLLLFTYNLDSSFQNY